MIQSIASWLSSMLGLGMPGAELDFLHMAARGLVVFAVGIVAVRLIAHRRFVSRNTPFDVILAITLGAILARAVNGTAPFLPTLGSALVLLLIDRLIVVASYRWEWFRHLVGGRSRQLVEDGRLDRRLMRRFHVSREDLLVELRRQGHMENLDLVHEAYLEPNGEISVVAKE
ncbi:MAG: DUF421 domain-containing protein [Candidatus Longimicrobiales bacterium M2_2A_002]